MGEALVALNALNRVEQLAEKLGQAENQLERGYAELAEAILDVQTNRYWEGAHASWGDYIKFITQKFNMGRAQLYHKVSVVKQLQGVVEPQELTSMGISKASVLADAHRLHGELPESAIESAKDNAVTVKQLKKSLAEALHIPEQESMEWYDLSFAFYVTPEEKKELQDAESVVRGIDPPISNTIKDFMQKKEVALRWAREVLATYATEVKEEEIPF